MNTQEFLAVSDLLKACGTFNSFAANAVIAAKGGVPLLVPDALEEELHIATVRIRIALGSLEPGIMAAAKRIEKNNEGSKCRSSI